MDTESYSIYVKLLNEGVEVWRPAAAEKVGDGVYRILAMAAPEEEKWEFEPGSLVRCQERVFEGNEIGLAAVEAIGDTI